MRINFQLWEFVCILTLQVREALRWTDHGKVSPIRLCSKMLWASKHSAFSEFSESWCAKTLSEASRVRLADSLANCAVALHAPTSAIRSLCSLARVNVGLWSAVRNGSLRKHIVPHLSRSALKLCKAHLHSWDWQKDLEETPFWSHAQWLNRKWW